MLDQMVVYNILDDGRECSGAPCIDWSCTILFFIHEEIFKLNTNQSKKIKQNLTCCELGCLQHCCHRHLTLFRYVHAFTGREAQEQLTIWQVKCVLVAEML